jgi:uncharacterized protein YxjI
MTTVLPRYTVNMGGQTIAEVVRQFLFKNEYKVTGLDWRVRGDFSNRSYVIENGYREIATVSKHSFALGDGYEISIPYDTDELTALSIVLVIEACMEAQSEDWIV